VADRILPVVLILLLPLFFGTWALTGQFPAQAVGMSIAAPFVGVWLIRKLWNEGAIRLEKSSRLRLVTQQGQAFDPESEEVEIHLDNARLNYLLGASFLTFSIVLVVCFVGSYFVVRPAEVVPSLIGQIVQIAVMLLVNLLVIGLMIFGAKIFTKR
jgi:hypothetical protein